ncbi:MAG: hypothetical protein NPINA01_08110 [Nitrospinaceae bacterium]|nr:MAG: hypothetical protein NPINA01_08110 [Nitrospinaceae bacterium]
MKNVSFSKVIQMVFMTCVIAVAATKSEAVQKPLLSDIEILDQIPIQLNENQQLDFGKIVPPDTGIQIFIVTPAGVGSPKIPGANGAFILSDEQQGLIDATGEVGATFTANGSVGPTPCTLAGTTLTAVAPELTTGTFPDQIKVGGTLTVDGDIVTAGTGLCEYTLDVNYN